MFIDYNRAVFPTEEQLKEFQKKYDEIIAHAIEERLCMVCEHAKTLEDYELNCRTSITVCEFSGKPIHATTCDRFLQRTPTSLLLEKEIQMTDLYSSL